jgi:Skp family chaperone for outer membrane proteins
VPIDLKKLAALAKRNAEKATKESTDANKKARQFDDTLQKRFNDSEERERFFKEMQKREF